MANPPVVMNYVAFLLPPSLRSYHWYGLILVNRNGQALRLNG